MLTQIYEKYLTDIEENKEHLLSKDFKISRMKPYTFVTRIKCNEFCQAEVRLEGMLHFKQCIFLK